MEREGKADEGKLCDSFVSFVAETHISAYYWFILIARILSLLNLLSPLPSIFAGIL